MAIDNSTIIPTTKRRLSFLPRRKKSSQSLDSSRTSAMKRFLRSKLMAPFRVVYDCLLTSSDGASTSAFPPRARAASLDIAPSTTSPPPPKDFFLSTTTRSLASKDYAESSVLMAPAPSRANTVDIAGIQYAYVEEDWVARVYGWRHDPAASESLAPRDDSHSKWSWSNWLRRKSDTHVHTATAAEPIITGQTVVLSAPVSPATDARESSSAGLSRQTRRSAPSVEEEARLNHSFQSRKTDAMLSFSVVRFDEPSTNVVPLDELHAASVQDPPPVQPESQPDGEDEDDWGMSIIAQRYSDRKGKSVAASHPLASIWDSVKQAPILVYEDQASPTKSQPHVDAKSVIQASRIYGASKEKIIEWMTLNIDQQFVMDFLLTYRSIMTPEELCTLLVSRFWWALREEEECMFDGPHTVDDHELQEKRLVRIRLYTLFKSWLLDHFQQDFLPRSKLRRKFTSFLNHVMKNVVISSSQRDLRIVKRLRGLYRNLWQYYHVRSLAQQQQQHAPSTSHPKHLPALPTDKPLPSFPWEESDLDYAGKSSDGNSVYSIEERALPDGASPLVHQQLHVMHKSSSLPNIKSSAAQCAPVQTQAVSSRRNSLQLGHQSPFTKLKTAVLRDISLVKRGLRHHKQWESSWAHEDGVSSQEYSSESEVIFTSAGEDEAHPMCTCSKQRTRSPILNQKTFEPLTLSRPSTPAITVVVNPVTADDERELSMWQRIGSSLSTMRPTTPRPDTGYGSDGRRYKRCAFCVERLKAKRQAAKDKERRSFVFDYRSTDIAHALWMVERKHLLSIRVGELMDKRSTVPSNPAHITGTNAVQQLVNRFNTGYQWVVSEVVSTPIIQHRVYLVEKFIRIALKCFLQGNYASCCQIVLGLNSLASRRLSKTWKRIGSYEMYLLSYFTSIVTPRGNWASIRHAMQDRVEHVLGIPLDEASHEYSMPGGCIPFLGPYLADLTFNAELSTYLFSNSSEHGNNLVHVHKLRIQARVIRQILAFQYLAQRTHYDVDNRLLKLCMDVKCLDNPTLMRMSASLAE